MVLSSKISIPARVPTQPPILWVPRAVSKGATQPGREAYHLSQSSQKVKNEWSYDSTPTDCLHGMHTRATFPLACLVTL